MATSRRTATDGLRCGHRTRPARCALEHPVIAHLPEFVCPRVAVRLAVATEGTGTEEGAVGKADGPPRTVTAARAVTGSSRATWRAALWPMFWVARSRRVPNWSGGPPGSGSPRTPSRLPARAAFASCGLRSVSRFRIEPSDAGRGSRFVLRVVGAGCVGISGSSTSSGTTAVTQAWLPDAVTAPSGAALLEPWNDCEKTSRVQTAATTRPNRTSPADWPGQCGRGRDGSTHDDAVRAGRRRLSGLPRCRDAAVVRKWAHPRPPNRPNRVIIQPTPTDVNAPHTKSPPGPALAAPGLYRRGLPGPGAVAKPMLGGLRRSGPRCDRWPGRRRPWPPAYPQLVAHLSFQSASKLKFCSGRSFALPALVFRSPPRTVR